MKSRHNILRDLFPIALNEIFFILLLTPVLTFIVYLALIVLQSNLFARGDYILWAINSAHLSKIFIGITMLYILYGLLTFTESSFAFYKTIDNFIRKYKFVFLIILIFIGYQAVFNISVIKNDSISMHSFSAPFGKEYSYNDIVKIDAGVYEKKPFNYSDGFYYIIELNDGKRLDLNRVGGSKSNKNHRFIIEEIDIKLVNMGIEKSVNMDNFVYLLGKLDTIQIDKIRDILQNTN